MPPTVLEKLHAQQNKPPINRKPRRQRTHRACIACNCLSLSVLMPRRLNASAAARVDRRAPRHLEACSLTLIRGSLPGCRPRALDEIDGITGQHARSRYLADSRRPCPRLRRPYLVASGIADRRGRKNGIEERGKDGRARWPTCFSALTKPPTTIL
jgi:hypothetical protein